MAAAKRRTATPDTSEVAAAFHVAALELTAAHTSGALGRTEMQSVRADARAVVECLPAHPSDALRDAAVEQAKERADEFRKVSSIVLGARPNPRYRVADVVRLGDDFAVEVVPGRDQPAVWTTVVGNERGNDYFTTQELAVLHLIARRYDDNPNSNIHAVRYAARVLGISEEK